MDNMNKFPVFCDKVNQAFNVKTFCVAQIFEIKQISC